MWAFFDRIDRTPTADAQRAFAFASALLSTPLPVAVQHGEARTGLPPFNRPALTQPGRRTAQAAAEARARRNARLHAVAEILKNVCRENRASGIGVDGAEAVVRDNQVINNALVALGIRKGSKVTLTGNTLRREGGMPPLVAVLEQSTVVMEKNVLHGGGVAGVLLQGTASISGNQFHGNGPRRGGPPNFAVWVRAGSTVDFENNTVNRWRHAVHAIEAQSVKANANQISQFIDTGIVIQNTKNPAEVTGNTAWAADPKAQAVKITGALGKVTDNQVKPMKKKVNE